MASASPVNLERVVRSPADRRRTAESQGFEGIASTQANASLAFSALFDVVRAATPTLGAPGVGGQTSPSQMFEPQAADAHGRRLEALEEEDRLALQRKDETHTRNLTAASRAPSPPAQSGVGRGVGDRELRVPVMRNDLSGASTKLGAGTSGAGDVRAGFGNSRPASNEGQLGAMGGALGGPRSPSLDSQLPPSRASHDVPTELSVRPPAGPSPGATPIGSDRSGSTPAQRVASMLAAGRETGASGRGSPGSSIAAAQENGAAGTAPEGDRAQGPKVTTLSRSESNEGTSKLGPEVRTVGAEPGFERFDDLVRSIRLFAAGPGARFSSARLQLQPPELGRIRVHLRVAGQDLTLEVRTETDEARDLLAARAAVLAHALEQHGLHVQRLDVAREPHGHPDVNTPSHGHTGPETNTQDSGSPSDGSSLADGGNGGTRASEDQRSKSEDRRARVVVDSDPRASDFSGAWGGRGAAQVAVRGVDIRV